MRTKVSITRWSTSASKRLRLLLNQTFAVWASVAALLLLAGLQPSADALEFPKVSNIVVPDIAALTVVADTTEALFTQLKTTAIISSDEIAQVSLESSQIEMARTTDGAQTVAKQIMDTEYSWNSGQFGCLKTLWTHESHWNYKAHNYSSGAHGIAQALPAEKMSVIADDWRTNPLTQIRWGLRYIDIRYDTPCKALANFNRNGSY